MRIRELVARQLSNASVSQVEIERGINHVTVTVHTAKPGIVIGKGGANVEALRTNIGKLTDKKVKLEIKEILQPSWTACSWPRTSPASWSGASPSARRSSSRSSARSRPAPRA
jgi:ribosomal protein S3